MSTLKTLELERIYAPIPKDHLVEVTTLRRQGLLGSFKAYVVHDLETGIFYANSRDTIEALSKENASDSVIHVDRGVVTNCFAIATGGDHTTHGTVLSIDPIETDDGSGRIRVVHSKYPRLVVTEERIEQRWPDRMVQSVIWGEPFQLLVDREPGERMSTMQDVHLKLQQRREGKLHRVAVTLKLPVSEEMLALPAKSEFLPAVEGADAQWLLKVTRYYAQFHGVNVPL